MNGVNMSGGSRAAGMRAGVRRNDRRRRGCRSSFPLIRTSRRASRAFAWPVVAVLAGLLIGFSAVQAGVIVTPLTTADGLGADSYVQSGTNAENNYGGLDVLAIKFESPGTGDVQRKAYLRFDLSALPFPQVIDAELALTVHSHHGPGAGQQPQDWTFNVWGLVDAAPGDQMPGAGGWIEGTGTGQALGDGSITWNNAPASAAGNALTSHATLLGQMLMLEQDVQGDIIRFSSPDLIDFLQQDTNGLVTLILTRQQSHPQVTRFFSKENTDSQPAPTLTVTIIPEPAALALLGLGGLLLRRRQKP